MKKRAFSLLLVLILIVSMGSVTAFADDTDLKDISIEEEQQEESSAISAFADNADADILSEVIDAEENVSEDTEKEVFDGYMSLDIEGIYDVTEELPLSGKCGSDLSWELVETEDGSDLYDLVFTGTGIMEDYSYTPVYDDSYDLIGYNYTAPWGYRAAEIRSVTIPEGVTGIGSNAFRNEERIKTITLPSTLEYIGEAAFYQCCGLERIAIPAGVTVIKDFTFCSCSSLLEVDFQETLTSIGNSAFAQCSSLTAAAIPATVTSIGYSCFSGCTALADVELPAGLTELPAWLFDGCSSLKQITLPSSLETIAKAFMNCTALESIEIPANTTEIKALAFSGCTALEKVTLNEGLKLIGPVAFGGTSLKTITIPESVTEIAESAFSKSITICGCTGSYAQEFAEKYGFTFVVVQIDINTSKVTGIKNKTYTGKAVTQSPKVVIGGVTLKKGTDYDLSYKNNKNAGKATVTITGKGKYGGSIKKTFTIKQAANPMTAKAKTGLTASSTAKTTITKAKAFTVSKAQGKVTFKKTKGDAKITVSSKGTVTIKKGLKKGTTYSVTVKVTAAGNKNYKAGFKTVTLKIKIK